jgi:hypothetical protein
VLCRSKIEKALAWINSTAPHQRRLFWIQHDPAAAAAAAAKPRVLNPAAAPQQLAGFISGLVKKERCALVKIKAGLALPAQAAHPNADVAEAAAAAKAAADAGFAAADWYIFLLVPTAKVCGSLGVAGPAGGSARQQLLCALVPPMPSTAAAALATQQQQQQHSGQQRKVPQQPANKQQQHSGAAAGAPGGLSKTAAAAGGGAGSGSAAGAASRSSSGAAPVSIGRARLLPEQYGQGQKQQQQRKGSSLQLKPPR